MPYILGIVGAAATNKNNLLLTTNEEVKSIR